jgi:hypothetical protein
VTERLAWRIILLLSVAGAGAYVGNESPALEYSHYFWDLTGYVLALQSEFPYRTTETFTFLYPPVAKDLFGLARTHLFELMSIGHVAALAWFLRAYSRIPAPRRWEWLFAITAMGGMGVVSLQSGNVALLMNFTLLGVAIGAALGDEWSRLALPIVIGAGALIKPQFALYLGLLPFVEASRRTAIIKILAVAVAVVVANGLYAVLRPFDWNEYVQGVITQTSVKRDFGWGPAALGTHLSSAFIAPYVAYLATLVLTAALCVTVWRTSVKAGRTVPAVSVIALAFLVLTFANPRVPLYDLFAAAIAAGIACSFAADARQVCRALVVVLAINLVPWTIEEFARNPAAWPWWTKDMLFGHLGGIIVLLIVLARDGLEPQVPGEPVELTNAASSA